MAEHLTPDICVIGAGSGGLSVAAAAAAFGMPVVLIEKGKMGGECLNTGCVPSKSLIAAGKRARAITDAATFGVSTQAADIDFAKVHRHVHGVIAAIAPNDSKERFNGLGVRVIEGAARFKDRNTVVVNATEIAARRFVVATGSSPALPPIAGLDHVPYLTNETVFDLTARPEHLIVIRHVVLAQEMFFEVEHLRVVVGAQLHGRLADLLLRGRELCAAVNEEDSLIGVEQQLARERQPGERGAAGTGPRGVRRRGVCFHRSRLSFVAK